MVPLGIVGHQYLILTGWISMIDFPRGLGGEQLLFDAGFSCPGHSDEPRTNLARSSRSIWYGVIHLMPRPMQTVGITRTVSSMSRSGAGVVSLR